MLFLLKATPRKDVVTASSVVYMKLVVSEWETVIKYKNEGRVLEAYCLADGSGAFSIWQLDSQKELENIVSELPLHPFTIWTITPLRTDENALVKAKKKLNSMCV